MAIYVTPAFSYDKELENLLWTSPNVVAMEYVYAINNNVENSIRHLENARAEVKNNLEPQIKKDIRLLQLNYLQTFVYLNQESTTFTKKKLKHLAKKMIPNNIISAESIMKARPEYSEVYTLVALFHMLNATTSVSGMTFFLANASTIRGYFQKAVELNPHNPFSRLSYANFDSSAPSIVGGDKKRALETLSYPIDESWPKILQFEYHLSKIRYAQYTDNPDLVEKEIANSLYPNNWRVDFGVVGAEE